LFDINWSLPGKSTNKHTRGTHTQSIKKNIGIKIATGIERNRKKLAVNPLKLNTADGVDVDGSDKELQQQQQQKW